MSRSSPSSSHVGLDAHGHHFHQQQQYKPPKQQTQTNNTSHNAVMNVVASPTSSASSSSSSTSSTGSSGDRKEQNISDGDGNAASLLQVVHENERIEGDQDAERQDSPATSEEARTFPASSSRRQHETADKVDSLGHREEQPVMSVNTSEAVTSNGNSLKSARRHSAGGMSTPVDENGPSSSQGIVTSEGGHSSGMSSRPNMFARSGHGFSSSSSFREGTEDGATRPARRKVMKVDANDANVPANGASHEQPFASGSEGRGEGSSIITRQATTASNAPVSISQHQSQSCSESSTRTPARPSPLPSMDITTYPTASLLHLLAELLARITLANDTARQQLLLDQQQLQQEATSGTVTPPAYISHSRAASGEPVSPAVPFSTPSMAFSTSQQQQQRSTGYPFPDLSSISEVSTAEEGVRQGENSVGPSLRPRYNFTCPGKASRDQQNSRRRSSLSSPSQRGGASASDHAPRYFDTRTRSATSTSQQSQSQHPQNHTRPTILSSAAHALATPNATLCFHARNVPSISIESYLVRISKYCPTTNEVFISLLVYFDRMSHLPTLNPPPLSLSSLDSTNTAAQAQYPAQQSQQQSSSQVVNASTAFAVDSFNIHRLIITGITVASKFFSDVFYTNSRYAKVGGLPLPELNALELQFLLLNGFDLVVPPEELQTYADHLLRGQLPPLRETTPTALSHSIESVSADRPLSPFPGANNHNTISRAHPVDTASAGAEGSSLNITRPKSSSNRSASESSTSASEASTLMPSESSVDTERGGNDEDGEEEQAVEGIAIASGDQEMRDEHDADAEDEDEDPFLAPRPPRSSGRSTKPSSGRGGRSSTTTALHGGKNTVNRNGSHKRENSRTRQWTDQQQRMQNLMVGEGDDERIVVQDQDTEMAD